MAYKWRKRQIIFLIIILALIIWYNDAPESKNKLIALKGRTMGTTYTIKYLDESGRYFQHSIDSILKVFNQSLSTYIPDSEISTFNTTSQYNFELPFFIPVLEKSKEIYKLSDGAFDPTVGPLVNAWGFGFSEREDIPDSSQVDSLLQLIGFNQLNFDNETITKKDGMVLDFSAIAKGYGVDVVSEYLSSKEITNYFVEIGGEVRCNGISDKNTAWKIGINTPDTENITNEIEAIIRLENQAMATSGNYRNFYEKDGKRYAHTINPKTGFPVEHNLLSASVIADNCMTADAWATAFMVIGLEKAKEIITSRNLEAYLIYGTENGKTASFISDGLQHQIKALK